MRFGSDWRCREIHPAGSDGAGGPVLGSIDRQIRLDQRWLAFAFQQAGGVSADPAGGAVAQLAGFQAERPEMNRADDAVAVDKPLRQAGSGMGAGVVNHPHLPFYQKHSQPESVDLDIPALSLDQFIKLTKTGPGHGVDKISDYGL